MTIDVQQLPSLTYAEAMAAVDAGRTVSRKSEWRMTAAGFAWGVWIDRQRRWTDEDLRRMRARSQLWTTIETEPASEPIEASGPYHRAFHTLCESVECGDSVPPEWLEATDWFDATEAMAEMWELRSQYFDDPGGFMDRHQPA